MSMPTNGNATANPPQPSAGVPQLSCLAQYVKDLSFENPNAPRSLQQTEPPQISVQVNVTAKPMAETDVEVELKLEGKAEVGGTLMFSFELTFAGVFRILNVPQEQVQPIMMIECPRILFPFAREIVATSVRNGGYPPLLLDPIDFVSLYQQRLQAAQQAQA
jgi:preprotein translocase subunit SecB